MKQYFAWALALLLLFAIGCQAKTLPEAELPTATPDVTAAPTASPAPTAVPTEEPPATEAPETDPAWRTVETEISTDANGNEFLTVYAYVEPGVTIRIEQPGMSDYTYTNDTDKMSPRKIHIPAEVFYPNAPVETAEYEMQPHITFTTPGGTDYEAICPSCIYTFPTITIEIKNRFYKQEANTYRADRDGTVVLEGKISETDAVLMLNGTEEIPTEKGKFKVRVSADAEYTISALKDNYAIAAVTFKVVPH